MPNGEGDQHARYVHLIRRGAQVRQHLDLFNWLQGGVQSCLPHDVLLAAWGNFEDGTVYHDVVSALPGVRSYALGTESLPFLLSKFYQAWVLSKCKPCELTFLDFEHFVTMTSLPGTFGHSMNFMRRAWVHGVADRRGRNESVYVLLSSADASGISASADAPIGIADALEVLLPSIDMAFRRVAQLPQQRKSLGAATKSAVDNVSLLSERETQIMAWVAMGKTNSEIGDILSISAFTVKNHMQRIFQKLNVFNRAQAVSKITRVAVDG
jgi:transcriptional regulator EpsA